MTSRFRRYAVPLCALLLAGGARAQDAAALDDALAALHARYAELAWRDPDALRAAPPALLLDAREPAEYAVSHLRGAFNAPTLAVALAALDGHPRATPVVVYCRWGERAAALARGLRQRGYTEVAVLDGAILAWSRRGLPLYRHGREVTELHPATRADAPR